jgi:hypothetical protein
MNWEKIKDILPPLNLRILLYCPKTSLGFSTIIIGTYQENYGKWGIEFNGKNCIYSPESHIIYFNVDHDFPMPIEIFSHWSHFPKIPE